MSVWRCSRDSSALRILSVRLESWRFITERAPYCQILCLIFSISKNNCHGFLLLNVPFNKRDLFYFNILRCVFWDKLFNSCVWQDLRTFRCSSQNDVFTEVRKVFNFLRLNCPPWIKHPGPIYGKHVGFDIPQFFFLDEMLKCFYNGKKLCAIKILYV